MNTKKGSNLLMLVVENEHEVERCGRIETLTRYRPTRWSERYRTTGEQFATTKTTTTTTTTTRQANASTNSTSNKRMTRKDYSINRYRKNPEYCHNYYANESNIFFCNSPAVSQWRLLPTYALYSSTSTFVLILIALFLSSSHRFTLI